MRLATLLALLLTPLACDGAAWETTDRVPLRIDIQSQFDDDRVRVEIGGVPVFDDRVTTMSARRLARVVEASVPPGETAIRATVNEGPSVRLDLDPAALGGVAVGFDGAAVSLEPFDTPPVYP